MQYMKIIPSTKGNGMASKTSKYRPERCCDTCRYYEWYWDKCTKYNCEVHAFAMCDSWVNHELREDDNDAE